jgi:hypothetical protein
MSVPYKIIKNTNEIRALKGNGIQIIFELERI